MNRSPLHRPVKVADPPGIDVGNIDISLAANRLTIRGEKKDAERTEENRGLPLMSLGQCGLGQS